MSDMTRRRLAAAKARGQIPVGLILRKLEKHIRGSVDLSPTQLRAAEILLKKSMPDMQPVDYAEDTAVRTVSELSREELQRIAAGGSEGIAEARGCDEDSASLH